MLIIGRVHTLKCPWNFPNISLKDVFGGKYELQKKTFLTFRAKKGAQPKIRKSVEKIKRQKNKFSRRKIGASRPRTVISLAKNPVITQIMIFDRNQ